MDLDPGVKFVEHEVTDQNFLQKYESTSKNLFCNFSKLVGHDESHNCALELMRERTYDAYRVHGVEEIKGSAV